MNSIILDPLNWWHYLQLRIKTKLGWRESDGPVIPPDKQDDSNAWLRKNGQTYTGEEIDDFQSLSRE